MEKPAKYGNLYWLRGREPRTGRDSAPYATQLKKKQMPSNRGSLGPARVDQLIRDAVERANRLDVDEPLLVMPEPIRMKLSDLAPESLPEDSRFFDVDGVPVAIPAGDSITYAFDPNPRVWPGSLIPNAESVTRERFLELVSRFRGRG